MSGSVTVLLVHLSAPNSFASLQYLLRDAVPARPQQVQHFQVWQRRVRVRAVDGRHHPAIRLDLEAVFLYHRHAQGARREHGAGRLLGGGWLHF